MRYAYLVIVLLCCCGALAKKQHEPLPDGVVNAKTVKIVNHTGRQEVADSAYDELQKWGRFQVVTSGPSDLVISLSRGEGEENSSYVVASASRKVYRMDVYLGNESTDAVFETMEAGSGVIHSNAGKSCVQDLEKRMKAH